VGEEATFNGSWSYDPDGYIISYEWDFGDNSSASGIFVTHAYDTPGLYYAMLTVTDDDNATSFDYSVVLVLGCEPPPSENHPPIAYAEPKFQEVFVNESAYFYGSRSYDPDGHIIAYEWDFGDGTFGFDANMEHSYDTIGVYHVSLTVTDNENATATDFCEVVVVDEREPPKENCPPIAFAMPKCQQIGVNETASFDGSGSVDLDGTIVSYEWDFGDGTSGTGVFVSHQYDEEGSYDVVLIVTDDDNASSSDICFVYVCESKEPWPGDNLPPVPDCTPKTREIFVGEYAKFHGTNSYDPDGYIISYKWDFSQGIIYNGVFTSHRMSQVGTFEVIFTVRDNQGAEASEVVTVTVMERSNDPPERPDPDLPDDGEVPLPDREDEEETLLILTAGLINVATFKEGWERIVPVEVVAYHGYVRSVSIELIDDGGLEIEVIPIVRNVPEGKIVKFYLKIRVPEFDDDTFAQGITIKLQAVGEDCESNVEYVDILISSEDMQEDPEYSEAATTIGTISGATILGLLLKRRFL
jgi:PKD repeat protein